MSIPLRNSIHRASPVWLAFFLALVSGGMGCKPRSKAGASDGPPASGSLLKPSVLLEKSEDKITVLIANAPEGTIAVTCRINKEPEVDCQNGLVIKGLKEGRYVLVVTFVTAAGKREEVREFAVQGDKVTETTTSSGGVGHEDIRFELGLAGPAAGWRNNEAVFRSKPLLFDFSLESNQACMADLLCSFTPDVWGRCDHANRLRLEIDPREIAEGFQKVIVKAVCDRPRIESKIIDLSWFGVEDDYLPLALARRTVRDVAHYSLAKQNDCLGELSFECAKAGAVAFSPCANVHDRPGRGFQIRAVCKVASGATRGPILTEP